MSDDCQVAIVGGGPVGVGLGIDLAQRGVSCAVIERNTALKDIPKGQLLTARTLEHFAFWGCADRIRTARVLPPDHTVGSITTHGVLFSDYWFEMRRPVHGDPRLFWERGERLPQYETERVLRQRLQELPTAKLILGTTVTRVEQDEHGVQLSLTKSRDSGHPPSREVAGGQSPSAGGRERVLRAEYVIGCDGARSLVRESCGIQRSGTHRSQRMMLVVFRSPELNRRLSALPAATTYRVLRAELAGWWQFFGRIDAEGAFFFHCPVPDDAAADEQLALRMLERAAGISLHAEVDHIRFWDGRIMQATAYRHGRAFIAGDAAHQHPPYGGYGLNTGLEDATNLGWKLSAVLDGWGGYTLLDSLGAERMPIFAAVGSLISSSIEQDRHFLEHHDPVRDRAGFKVAWRRLRDEPSILDVQQEPHYEGSPIVCGAGSGSPGIDIPKSHAARAGHHLSPLPLSGGESAFSRLGPAFTLLALDCDDDIVERFGSAAHALGVPLKVIRDTCAGDRAAWGARLILVRPDQYVAWAAGGAPGDIEVVLANAVGAR